MKDGYKIGFWNYVDTGVLDAESAADDWKALGMNTPMSFEYDPAKNKKEEMLSQLDACEKRGMKLIVCDARTTFSRYIAVGEEEFRAGVKQAAAEFFKIPPEHVIILCDDVTQSPGKVRIRPSGSAGGHNGLKDIIARLGSQDFARVRLGVGEKPSPDYDLADWVLGRLSGADRKAFESRLEDVAQAVELILDGKLPEAQNRFNH